MSQPVRSIHDPLAGARGVGTLAGPDVRAFSAVAYLRDLSSALRVLDVACVERMADAIERCCRSGGTVFCMGNGGSASTASHIATDLTKLTLVPGNEHHLRVMSLVDSVGTLTAAGNDVSYDHVFVEPLRSWLRRGDVVIGISTSGRSPNVLRGAEFARQHGAVVLGLTGSTGHPLEELSDETLVIESESVQHVEDVTMIAGHLLCLMVRERRERAAAGEPMLSAGPSLY